MLDIETARNRMVDAVSPCVETENLALEHSLGRVLAQDVVSSISVPPSDNSAMDGYAINTEAVTQAGITLPISQRIAAGTFPEPLHKGTAARIFTGAVIPNNANAVVMQEDCEKHGDSVTINTDVLAHQNIRRKGQDIEQGHRIVLAGERLEPQHIGLIASAGETEVCVYKKLRVVILSTGDELTERGTSLKPGQIYNSNQPMLQALLNSQHCETHIMPVVADTLEATKDSLLRCIDEADLIISTGGVSVGEEDHVKKAVETLGELNLWKIKIKPGKPLAFGQVSGTPFVGLPGNPVSAFVTFLFFAIPIIHKLQGRNAVSIPSFSAKAAFSHKKRQSRPELIRAKMRGDAVERFPTQSSGVLTSVCWADVLACIPENTPINSGDLIDVFPLSHLIHR